MDYKILEEGEFKYVEEGEGKVLLLLHGLFGALSNFKHIIDEFKDEYKVVIPLLPIYDQPIKKLSVVSLTEYAHRFVQAKGYDKVNVLGNSLGGHISLLFTLAHQERVSSLILTGSSGLFENSLGSTFPKRGNYEYVKERTEYTFYDPKVASKEMVDEIFDMVNDRNKAIRIVIIAKSALRHNLGDKLDQIKVPTLLIWGKQDTITPAFVGEEFQKGIKGSELYIVDKCGHAPMMERPEEFNSVLSKFLSKLYVVSDSPN